MENKKFVNANELLPTNLVKEIQKYVNGAYLYIPKIDRNTWGTKTGIREELQQRNKLIVSSFNKGMHISSLAEEFCLSEERIRAIVYGCVYRNKQLKEHDKMVSKEHFDKELVKEKFNDMVKNNNLDLEYVDASYLRVHDEDTEDTLTYYFRAPYNESELHDTMKILGEKLGITLSQSMCLRHTD
jgi:Mor family transcriptional regulator